MANQTTKPNESVRLSLVLEFKNMNQYQAFMEEFSSAMTDYSSVESAELTGLPPVLDVKDQF